MSWTPSVMDVPYRGREHSLSKTLTGNRAWMRLWASFCTPILDSRQFCVCGISNWPKSAIADWPVFLLPLGHFAHSENGLWDQRKVLVSQEAVSSWKKCIFQLNHCFRLYVHKKRCFLELKHCSGGRVLSTLGYPWKGGGKLCQSGLLWGSTASLLIFMVLRTPFMQRNICQCNNCISLGSEPAQKVEHKARRALRNERWCLWRLLAVIWISRSYWGEWKRYRNTTGWQVACIKKKIYTQDWVSWEFKGYCH